jgi:hypothetical protein
MNAGIKSRIRANHKGEPTLREALLDVDWHLGVIPEYVTEVRGNGFFSTLSTLHRPVLLMGTKTWCTKVPPYPHLKPIEVAGLIDDTIPTLKASKQQQIASHIDAFAKASFEWYDANLRATARREAARDFMVRRQADQEAAAVAAARRMTPGRAGTITSSDGGTMGGSFLAASSLPFSSGSILRDGASFSTVNAAGSTLHGGSMVLNSANNTYNRTGAYLGQSPSLGGVPAWQSRHSRQVSTGSMGSGISLHGSAYLSSSRPSGASFPRRA